MFWTWGLVVEVGFGVEEISTLFDPAENRDEVGAGGEGTPKIAVVDFSGIDDVTIKLGLNETGLGEVLVNFVCIRSGLRDRSDLIDHGSM